MMRQKHTQEKIRFFPFPMSASKVTSFFQYNSVVTSCFLRAEPEITEKCGHIDASRGYLNQMIENTNISLYIFSS